MLSYSDCMKQISKEELFEGLLGYGLFADQLPPFLSSEAYYKYACEHPFSNDGYKSQYVFYEAYRNINIPRSLGIPTPLAYENLCRCLRDNWSELQEYFADKTSIRDYKVSRTHIRKLEGKKSLFEMNYDNWKIDGSPVIDLSMGKRYMVKTDISSCFPSMYSHSLCWALKGKAQAKLDMNKKTKGWQEKLDYFSRNLKDGETHGFIIGPHASNLLSEIILTDIDCALVLKGWQYLRHIDDSACYVKSQDEAHRFLQDSIVELRKYDLVVNAKKTKITPLPVISDDEWVVEMRNATHVLNVKEYIRYDDVRDYLDTAILIAQKAANYSALSFAFSVLKNCKMGTHNPYKPYKDIKTKTFSSNAIEYVKKSTRHYVLIYPYLVHFLEDNIMIPFGYSDAEIEQTANMLFDSGIESRDYEASSFALYFAVKYSVPVDNFNVDEVLQSENCILLLLSYLYSVQCGLNDCKDKLIKKAQELSNDKEGFDRFWLFVYEVMPEDMLTEIDKIDKTDGRWHNMKRAGVSFIRKDIIAALCR